MNETGHLFNRPFTSCSVMLLLMLGPFLGVSQAQDLPPEVLNYADTVLYNGHVLTMDRDRPPINVTQAIALRDGRVLAVGDSDRILPMAGPDTVKVDLEGRAVIPGVIDTHSHPNRYALSHYKDEYNLAYVQATGLARIPRAAPWVVMVSACGPLARRCP